MSSFLAKLRMLHNTDPFFLWNDDQLLNLLKCDFLKDLILGKLFILVDKTSWICLPV